MRRLLRAIDRGLRLLDRVLRSIDPPRGPRDPGAARDYGCERDVP